MRNIEVESYEQPTPRPTQKVAAGGIGGSISVVLLYLIETTFNVSIPAEVAAAAATVVSFAAAYIVREKRVVE